MSRDLVATSLYLDTLTQISLSGSPAHSSLHQRCKYVHVNMSTRKDIWGGYECTGTPYPAQEETAQEETAQEGTAQEAITIAAIRDPS